VTVPCACVRCRDRRKRGLEPAHDARELLDAKSEVSYELPKAPAYVVVWAQNATPVHRAFWAALQRFCAHRGASLIVIPGRYKNPTSTWSRMQQEQDRWAREVEPFLFAGRGRIGKLTIFGDVSIQPTAVRPLSGFEVFAGEQSAVFGHPKLQLLTVATAKRRWPRIFTSTGACTRTNYSDSKAGKKGSAHHVLGATLIERGRGDLFHLRQINAAPDGSFIDLDEHFSVDRVRKAARAEALICGDGHDAYRDKQVLDATFAGAESICGVYKPLRVVHHDALHFAARNHHTIDDFMDRYNRTVAASAIDDVECEVRSVIRFIDEYTPKNATPFVVRSNHDEAFDRWLKRGNPFEDPINAEFWFKTWTRLIEERNASGRWPNALASWYREWGKGRAVFLERDSALRIKSIECGFHGDRGANGAIGSALGFSKLGGKTMIGHSHTPQIIDGCYQVGVMGALDQGYNTLPSSWLNTHGLVLANGKRQLINIIDGDWKR
jgi:hypothetical protein